MLEDILNSKWFLISLVVAVVLIIVAALFRLLTPDEIIVPQTAITSTNIDSSTSSFSNITFSGDAPSVPSSFSIAQAQINQSGFQQSLSTIQQEYDLKPDPQNTNLWKNSTYTLLFSPTNNTYHLSRSGVPSSVNGFPEDQRVVEAAQTMVNQFFPNSSLEISIDQLQYQSAGLEPQASTRQDAASVAIPFSYQVDGYPVYFQNSFKIPFVLVLEPSLKIQLLQFPNQLLTITPLSNKNSISIAQAINNMNTLNKGSIIVSLFTGYEGTSLENIIGGELIDVSIEYRLDEQTNLLIPFYRFSGTLINANNNKIEAQVITPAVETEAVR